jgi:hypothetical protein
MTATLVAIGPPCREFYDGTGTRWESLPQHGPECCLCIGTNWQYSSYTIEGTETHVCDKHAQILADEGIVDPPASPSQPELPSLETVKRLCADGIHTFCDPDSHPSPPRPSIAIPDFEDARRLCDSGDHSWCESSDPFTGHHVAGQRGERNG